MQQLRELTRCSSSLFTQHKRFLQLYNIFYLVKVKMSKKTHKQRKNRRRTLRRKAKRGGADSQALTIPTSALKVASPVNSTDIMGGISKL